MIAFVKIFDGKCKISSYNLNKNIYHLMILQIGTIYLNRNKHYKKMIQHKHYYDRCQRCLWLGNA